MARTGPTYYTILGVDADATSDDIRKSFRKSSRHLHPDMNGGVELPAYLIVMEAYTTLSDPEARARYDAELAEPDHADTPPAPPPPPSDMPEARSDTMSGTWGHEEPVTVPERGPAWDTPAAPVTHRPVHPAWWVALAVSAAMMVFAVFTSSSVGMVVALAGAVAALVLVASGHTIIGTGVVTVVVYLLASHHDPDNVTRVAVLCVAAVVATVAVLAARKGRKQVMV